MFSILRIFRQGRTLNFDRQSYWWRPLSARETYIFFNHLSDCNENWMRISIAREMEPLLLYIIICIMNSTILYSTHLGHGTTFVFRCDNCTENGGTNLGPCENLYDYLKYFLSIHFTDIVIKNAKYLLDFCSSRSLALNICVR